MEPVSTDRRPLHPATVRRPHRRARGAEGLRQARLSGVVEARAVAADAAVGEIERAVVDTELVGDQLLAGPLVAGDHARNGLATRVPVADADADAVADPQPLAATGVVDVDLDRPHRDQLARLPHPRKVLLRVAAEPAGEDAFERGALLLGRARVEVQHPRPRRPRLAVAVAERERDRKPGDVEAVDGTVLDQPRQDAHADAVRRAPAGHAVDPAARADRVAVARLEVAAANPPAHFCISLSVPNWFGWVRPGTVAGEAATQTPPATRPA